MDRESEEQYKQFRAEYEAKQKERRDNPDKYPYFVYFQFGYHGMTYMTEEEVQSAIKFYHLHSDGHGGYDRVGRQPIFIVPRKETKDDND